jgi:site-specific DNA-methyltransferase (adenine-specific)/modification methylase
MNIDLQAIINKGGPWKEARLIGDCLCLLGDCREILPMLPKVDAVVTDPPYGIGEAAGKNRSRSKLAVAKNYGHSDWDNEPCSSQQIAIMRECSRWQIIFGGNYFDLPATSCWLVWDKLNGNNDFADCELAWTNLPKAVRRIQYRWHGMLRQNNEPRGDHPTQKPVGVMKWCITHLPCDCLIICDPFMGSGTTGVSCVQLKRQFIGIECEKKYFDIGVQRIEEATRQGQLFTPQQKQNEQISLL